MCSSDLHTGLVSDGQQVQHGVGGAAQSHIAGQSVADGTLVDDLAGRDAALDQIHDGHTGVLAQLQTFGVDRRDGAVAGQGNADGLAQAVHAVGYKGSVPSEIKIDYVGYDVYFKIGSAN